MANSTVCQSKRKPIVEPRRAKSKTYHQAPTHWLMFYEEVVIESQSAHMQDSSDEAQRHARLLAEKKKIDEIQSFADRKDMKKFFDALKTVYGPRAQEPPHSLVQTELVLWLTKKLSWKDRLNTLMVSLIGHHLSMIKLSTDYHRWNVIRCLMSSQPSLKQWKQ